MDLGVLGGDGVASDGAVPLAESWEMPGLSDTALDLESVRDPELGGDADQASSPVFVDLNVPVEFDSREILENDTKNNPKARDHVG